MKNKNVFLMSGPVLLFNTSNTLLYQCSWQVPRSFAILSAALGRRNRPSVLRVSKHAHLFAIHHPPAHCIAPVVLVPPLEASSRSIPPK